MRNFLFRVYAVPQILGCFLGVTGMAASLAIADPVPSRPAKPRQAQKLPRCQGSQRGIEVNGPDFTGTMLQMSPLCEPLPQLTVVRTTNGVTLDGKTVLKDVVFQGGGLQTASVKGEQLKGAMVLGWSEYKRPVRLRIDAVEVAPDPQPKTPANENADVWLYRVSAQQGTGSDPSDAQFHPNVGPTGEWAPLCADGKLAVAVPGVWDYTVGEGGGRKLAGKANAAEVTFACVGSAIAKCVTVMGYKPWKSAAPTGGGAAVSLDELHQTCVRAVRADYCGNGESMTQAGEHVNFYDRFGIQRDESSWPLEAMWGPDGALCINSTRLVTAPENLRSARQAVKVRDYIRDNCPTRFSEKPCSQTDVKGALLWTEVAPQNPDTTPRN